jgi:hypothetical protein
MFLSVFLALAICIIVLFIVLFFAPITLSCSGSYLETSRHISFLFSWFHPCVFRCAIDEENHSFSIVACNRFKLFSSEEDEAPRAEPVLGKGSEDHGQQEKPVVEKSSPPDEKKQEYDRVPPVKKPTPEKTAGNQGGEHVDNKEQAGRKKKKLFGFMDPSQEVKRVLVFLRESSWRAKIFRWLCSSFVRFLHIISLSRYRVRIKAGLDDPGKTGEAFGYYIALKHVLFDTGNSRKEIVFEPDFTRDVLEAEGELEIATSMARLCLPVVLAIITFPFIHSFILYRRAKRIKTE